MAISFQTPTISLGPGQSDAAREYMGFMGQAPRVPNSWNPRRPQDPVQYPYDPITPSSPIDILQVPAEEYYRQQEYIKKLAEQKDRYERELRSMYEHMSGLNGYEYEEWRSTKARLDSDSYTREQFREAVEAARKEGLESGKKISKEELAHELSKIPIIPVVYNVYFHNEIDDATTFFGSYTYSHIFKTEKKVDRDVYQLNINYFMNSLIQKKLGENSWLKLDHANTYEYRVDKPNMKVARCIVYRRAEVEADGTIYEQMQIGTVYVVQSGLNEYKELNLTTLDSVPVD